MSLAELRERVSGNEVVTKRCVALPECAIATNNSLSESTETIDRDGHAEPLIRASQPMTDWSYDKKHTSDTIVIQ